MDHADLLSAAGLLEREQRLIVRALQGLFAADAYHLTPAHRLAEGNDHEAAGCIGGQRAHTGPDDLFQAWSERHRAGPSPDAIGAGELPTLTSGEDQFPEEQWVSTRQQPETVRALAFDPGFQERGDECLCLVTGEGLQLDELRREVLPE